jgi:hypothetical protein
MIAAAHAVVSDPGLDWHAGRMAKGTALLLRDDKAITVCRTCPAWR